jgi:CHAT domain-containing protein
MNEERRQAYLNLIISLLTHPSEEVNQILQANSELVDAGLVQVMLEEANNLRIDNNLDDANTLMTLAGHLMGTYSDNTQEEKSSPSTYLEFLEEVLQATADSNGDRNVVYALLRDNLNLINDDFLAVLRNWMRETFPNLDSQEDRIFIISIVFTFSDMIWQFPLGNRASNLEIAIAGYELALIVCTRQEYPEAWARTQNNLATAYSTRIRGEKADNLEIAISAYQATLSVFTRDAFPQDWAQAQNNLGLAYSNRIRGEKADNLEMAISFSQAALTIYNRETFPFEWARSQNNLGTAYLYRIRGEKADNLEMAISASEASLGVYTREAFPLEWANSQTTLGIAYLNRIRGEKADNIEMAIVAFEASLEICTREALPFEWSATQTNLGIAFSARIRGERAHNLEQAILCSQAALEIYTCEAFPFEWARSQNNLGEAYINRIRGEKADNLEMAISASEASLSIYTREAFPQDWAGSQNNLGIAYLNRIRGEKADNLEMSISASEASLSVYTRETFPFEWARSQNNLGEAYRNRIIGERATNLEKAISACEASLSVYTREAFPFEWARSQNNLGLAYRNRIRDEKADNLKKAIFTCEASLSVYTSDAFPINHAHALCNLGLAYWDNCQLPEAYNTFNTAIETVESIRSDIIIGGEADRQRLAEEWNGLYQAMIKLCLDRENKTAALEYIERSKTRNLVELFHNVHSPSKNVRRISFYEIRNLLGENEAILEWYITFNGFKVFIITRDSTQPDLWHSSFEKLQELAEFMEEYINDYIHEHDNWRNQLSTRLESLAEILHIDEIISRLPETCQKLILVPFRYLHLLPLHALTSQRLRQSVEETGTLLELFLGGVRYTPSCQLLQLSQRINPTGEESSPTRLFAIQNPTADLDFTDIEVEAIAKFFNPAEVLIRENASKTGLQQQLEALQNADIAHFSCHGFFDFLDPRKSALILAGAKISTDNIDSENKSYIRSPQDELLDIEKCLTLEEIFDLPLSKCSLVTLSACETGLTDIRDSTDEYIGLPSGFLYAGATNIISTLWAVNDVSTAILMIKFYELLLSKNRPAVAVALRESQLWLRSVTVKDLLEWVEASQLLSREHKQKIQDRYSRGYKQDYQPYESPVYWAAFCAVGQ